MRDIFSWHSAIQVTRSDYLLVWLTFAGSLNSLSTFWLYTGVRVNISGLFFTPRCPQDSGNYTVMAVNDYALESAFAFIHVVCQYTRCLVEIIYQCFRNRSYKTRSLVVGITVFSNFITARWTSVQSAVLQSHVVCPSVCLSVRLSVCDVGELWSHRLEFFENNFTIS